MPDDDRPHFHPVTTPAGHVLSCDAPDDHPWHHGLWFTIKYVNGENFWEQAGGEGTLRAVGAPVAVDTPLGPAWRTEIDWVRPDSAEVVLRQTLVATAVENDDPAAAVVDIDTTLVGEGDVVLDRTPFTTWGGYGGLAFRGRPDLVDSRFLLADGTTSSKLLGVRSAWIDLSGEVPDPTNPKGTAAVGITVLDGSSPGPAPVPWYGSVRSRVYGTAGWSNFFNAAFLWDGPLAVPALEVVRFRARVIAHDGIGRSSAIDAEHARYRAVLDRD